MVKSVDVKNTRRKIMQIYDRDRNKIWVDVPFPQLLSL